MEEGAARVTEFGRPRQHGALDQVAATRIGVDGRAAVHERVEEGESGVEAETLGPDLEDQEGPVAGGLDVHGDKLRFHERHVGTDSRRVDVREVPGHGLGATRLQLDERFWGQGFLSWTAVMDCGDGLR